MTGVLYDANFTKDLKELWKRLGPDETIYITNITFDRHGGKIYTYRDLAFIVKDSTSNVTITPPPTSQ
jgi:hypothetical protein